MCEGTIISSNHGNLLNKDMVWYLALEEKFESANGSAPCLDVQVTEAMLVVDECLPHPTMSSA
jgi:hypothetical protein